MTENNGAATSPFVAFATGALLGAGLAMLLAPRSGKELREALAGKGQEIKGKAENVLHEAEGFIGEKKDVLMAAVNAGKSAMEEERKKHQAPTEDEQGA